MKTKGIRRGGLKSPESMKEKEDHETSFAPLLTVKQNPIVIGHASPIFKTKI